MQKRWYFSKNMEKYFSSRRWTNQTSWRRSRSENIHLDTASTNSKRKSRWFSWRITRVSSTTSRLTSGCRWSDKWFLAHVRKLHTPPSRWTQSQALLAERRIIPYSTEIHWRNQNYSYEFGCQARATHRWLLEISMGQEICLILGQVSLNLLHWKKNLQTEFCGPGSDWRETADIQARPFMARTLGENGKECQAEGEAEVHEKPQLDNARKYEEFFSLTRRIRNSRRPSRMLARNWKHQWLPLCLARSARTIRIVGMVIIPIKPKQNLCAFWKPVNLQDCVWENLYRIIMKTILQEKGTIHYSIKFGSQIYSYASSHENSRSKGSGGQGMGKLEKTSAWNLTKVKSKKKVIDEARTSGAKVHFASLMDISHLKNVELELKHQKYKGRVVLRGDIAKDDSGSYAIFTEQGSSAS